MTALSKYNEVYKFLLLVIDTFSKYGWIVPLQNKQGVTVADALKKIFEGRRPGKLWTDKGNEFYNKDVKRLVELYSTENKEKKQYCRKMDKNNERENVEIFYG